MPNHALFSVMGIEIEYMLVDEETLDVCPKSDVLIQKLAGKIINEFSMGSTAISNELVLHVLEVKNTPPQPPTAELIHQFQSTLDQLRPALESEHLCLLPTASHPWMNPHTETRRWPHDNHEIYQAYDRIFDCKGHGWSNLQSMHVNLPFANDTEFKFLHNAIRLLLPLLPAIAASSPIHDANITGYVDTRLHYYNHNQLDVPEIAGLIIPEFIESEADYRRKILEPMFEAIKPFDPDHILQNDWLNSRGAIPKFDYPAIEIRLLDTQECVTADISIALLIHTILKSWWSQADRFLQNPCDTRSLHHLYLSTIKQGLEAPMDDHLLRYQLGLGSDVKTCREAWSALIEQVAAQMDPQCQFTLEHILTHGNLSERILKKTEKNPSRDRLKKVYQALAACLKENVMFE